MGWICRVHIGLLSSFDQRREEQWFVPRCHHGVWFISVRWRHHQRTRRLRYDRQQHRMLEFQGHAAMSERGYLSMLFSRRLIKVRASSLLRQSALQSTMISLCLPHCLTQGSSYHGNLELTGFSWKTIHKHSFGKEKLQMLVSSTVCPCGAFKS